MQSGHLSTPQSDGVDNQLVLQRSTSDDVYPFPDARFMQETFGTEVAHLRKSATNAATIGSSHPPIQGLQGQSTWRINLMSDADIFEFHTKYSVIGE